jgi:Tfp pilus assembly PilM family ATPase
MAKKIAIDWDEGELRLVAAQCSGRSVKVTDAVVIPITEAGIQSTLKSAITSRGLQEAPALVAIGRGQAELRELQLPPVPDDELPEMVRFQAIRSFASAGENATVDYLVTNRKDDGVEMIAAAVTPASLKEIHALGEQADVPIERVALRPLSAAALYLTHHSSKTTQDTVLIDLLSDDAEIVVAREGRVIFVRTVRMPTTVAGRARALGGELKRSLVACGSTGSLDSVVLWGKESVHIDDLQMLADASGAKVQALDPFTLVDVDRKLQNELPEHAGRLAPLIGLLAADENDGNLLIDFLNPRKKVEEVVNPYRKAALIGIPIAAVALIAFAIYFQLRGLDQQIADLKSSNATMKSDVDTANKSVQRTEKIDAYLDGDVNWLNELRRMATTIPASEELIVRGISASSNTRSGGGVITLEGAVTEPAVIDKLEQSLRDENHRVAGDGASEKPTNDAYRWGFVETITVTPESIRNERYEAIATLLASEKASQTTEESAPNTPATEDPATEDPATEDPATEDPATEDPATEGPAGGEEVAAEGATEADDDTADDNDGSPPDPPETEAAVGSTDQAPATEMESDTDESDTDKPSESESIEPTESEPKSDDETETDQPAEDAEELVGQLNSEVQS